MDALVVVVSVVGGAPKENGEAGFVEAASLLPSASLTNSATGLPNAAKGFPPEVAAVTGAGFGAASTAAGVGGITSVGLITESVDDLAAGGAPNVNDGVDLFVSVPASLDLSASAAMMAPKKLGLLLPASAPEKAGAVGLLAKKLGGAGFEVAAVVSLSVAALVAAGGAPKEKLVGAGLVAAAEGAPNEKAVLVVSADEVEGGAAPRRESRLVVGAAGVISVVVESAAALVEVADALMPVVPAVGAGGPNENPAGTLNAGI